MPTLVLDPPPPAFERLLEERRRAGADRRDEVWKGVLHMIPPPSVEHERLAHRLHVLLDLYATAVELLVTGTVGIGEAEDYCVPDLALLRAGYSPQWNRTAALVVEIVSPHDRTWEKVPFYAAHGVDELLIVDPSKRSLDWLALDNGEYRPIERSRVMTLSAGELAEAISWP